MKTVILDDDPTGTQSATDAHVLLEPSEAGLRAILRDVDAAYVLTNSRAMAEADAVRLVREMRDAGLRIAEETGEPVQFVLRGDSTLRGHVFAESEVLLEADPDAVLLFVPAFPAGGRVTVDGVHSVTIDGVRVPAGETEFAEDPVFPFASSDLVDYVAEKSDRTAIRVPLVDVREGGVAEVLRSVPGGAVVTPDVETDDDIRLIADAVDAARDSGRVVVVRSASPLAATLAGVASDGLLSGPLVERAGPVLVVCGSHTRGAGAQLEAVDPDGADRVVLRTEHALAPSVRAHDAAVDAVRTRLRESGTAILATERVRSADHDTLDHGGQVMTALTDVVRDAYGAAEVVVAKGGITSAEVARTGLGAETAVVLGQVVPGVSVWRLTAADGRSLLYVVVPGNVGAADTIADVLAALRVDVPLRPAR